MEIVQHALGLCGDNHSHLDFVDILLYGSGGLTTTMYYFRFKIKSFWDNLRKND